MKSASRLCVLICVCLSTATMAAPARADASADSAAIARRLHQWAADFNVKNSAGTCDLFAPTLISTVPDAPDAGREVVCARLATLLARTDAQFHYGVDIHEIIVSGDIAVVRLTWTLTLRRGTTRQVSREAGMDIFQRQATGTWSIVRFIAFSTPVKASEVPSPSHPNPGISR